jgi:hypothetical protein
MVKWVEQVDICNLLAKGYNSGYQGAYTNISFKSLSC